MRLSRPGLGVVGAVLLLAGCSAPGTSGSSGGNSSLANAYLATGCDLGQLLQWNTSGVGTFTADTLTGTAPNEQVSSDQTPITASVNGSEVTFTGLTQDAGTLANGTLSLQVLDQQTGVLGTDTFTRATQDQFNQAALKLSNQAGTDNSAAVQAQQWPRKRPRTRRPSSRRRRIWPPCRASALPPT